MDIHGRYSAAPQRDEGRYSAALQHDDGSTSILTDLLKSIGSHIQQIFRTEMEDLRTELAGASRRAEAAAVMLAAGGLVLAVALGFLSLAAMFALEMVLPSWFAALVVGAVLLIVSLWGLSIGRQRLKAVPPPREALPWGR